MNDIERIEQEVYERLCARCPLEIRCHKDCDVCDSFMDAVENAELGANYEIQSRR